MSVHDGIDVRELDRWITGNWGTDNDPEIRRPNRPLVADEDVIATEDFDEFAQISDDEMTIITVKAGDLGRLVREQSIDGTVGVVFYGRTVDLWPHQVRRAT